MLSPDIRRARWQHRAFGLPDYALRTWEAQHQIAQEQDVPFLFTCLSWHWWWRQELRKVGPEARYGLRCGRYRLRRIDDQGAYEDGNVFVEPVPVPPRISRSEAMKRWHASRVCWLKGRSGDQHPTSKPVLTPLGRFGSAAEAARAFGVTRTCVHLRVHRGEPGWRFAPVS